MIVLLSAMLRRAMTRGRVEEARRHADRELPGCMAGHAAMDMSVGGDG